MPIDEQTLESFLSGNLSVLDEIIGTDASELKNILNSATISGMQTSEILNQVSVASSASGQRAILNTRLNTYSRVATNTMMKDAPSDTKYVYVGPVDEKTRPECLSMASAGAKTEAEIVSTFGSGVLVDGGGINCRHKWEIASDEGIKLFEGKQAQQVIAGKAPKPFVSKSNVYEGFSASKKATNLYLSKASEEIIQTVRDYTSNTYGAINSYMRGGTTFGFSTSLLKKEINNLRSFLVKAPKHKGTVHRTLGFEPNEKNIYNQLKNFFLNNDEFLSKQFMSTSDVLQSGFADYKNGFTINLKILNSQSGVNLGDLSVFNQREILLPDGTKFKIINVSVRKNVKSTQYNYNLNEVLDIVMEEIND